MTQVEEELLKRIVELEKKCGITEDSSAKELSLNLSDVLDQIHGKEKIEDIIGSYLVKKSIGIDFELEKYISSMLSIRIEKERNILGSNQIVVKLLFGGKEISRDQLLLI